MLLASIGFALASAALPDARFALALYCNPTCSDEVISGLDDSLASLKSRSGFPQQASKPGRIMGIAGPEFGIPDADFVATYGVDVDRPTELAASQQLVLAWFAAPRSEARAVLRVAHRAFGEAAVASGGWVEDLDTQKLYGAAAWQALDPDGALDAWYVIDAELHDSSDPAGDLRLVTRGLRRFGLPDLVVDAVSPEVGGDVSLVIAATATALATRDELEATLSIADSMVSGTATFTEVGARESDPLPPLYELNFDGEITLPVVPGTELEEAPEVAPGMIAEPVAVVSTAPVGPAPAPVVAAPAVTAPAVPVAPPATLEEARARAMSRLDNEVQAAFRAGLGGGAVAVSVPFSAGATREYLWVELRSWEADLMIGVLATQPAAVPGLTKGDVVQIRRAEVFDYVWKKADGTREGNTTAAFLKP